jgi:hypothetical protein
MYLNQCWIDPRGGQGTPDFKRESFFRNQGAHLPIVPPLYPALISTFVNPWRNQIDAHLYGITDTAGT